MFGNLGEMAGMLKKLKDAQSNIKKAQDEMAKIEVTAKSSCGSVEVVVKGDFTVKNVIIKESAAGDVELLQNAVSEAFNLALVEVRKKALEQLSGITGGLNIPGLF